MNSARIVDFDMRFNYLVKLIKEYRVDVVVYFFLKFCDINLMDFLNIKKKIAKYNIPILFIELEYSVQNIEHIKTRIQAFFEML